MNKIRGDVIILDNENSCKLYDMKINVSSRFPRIIWQELNTKLGTVEDYYNIKRLIEDREFNMDDFYLGNDPIIMTNKYIVEDVIFNMNYFRALYLETGDDRWIEEIQRIIPNCFMEDRVWNTSIGDMKRIIHTKEDSNAHLNDEWKLVIQVIKNLSIYVLNS